MISFHYFTPTGLGKFHSDLQVSPKEWMVFCGFLETGAYNGKLLIFYPPVFVRSDKHDLLLNYGCKGCTARNLERLAIFPDRRVYICSAFFDSELHYGTFNKGSIRPRSQIAENEISLVSSVADNCKKCPNNSFCKAGCAAYDYFEHTYPTKQCDKEIVPICPLWSMPIYSEDLENRHYNLR